MIPQAIRTTIALIGLLVLASPVVSAADGDLDPWFGTGGKVTTAFPGGAFGAAVAVDQARKIVVAGAAAGASGMGEIALARYDADGDLDSTFGDGGRVTTPIAGGNGDEARSVAIQENGRIVVAGYNSRGLALARFRRRGASTVRSPGTARSERSRARSSPSRWPYNDGRIVVTGDHDIFRVGLARIRRDGRLDRSFGATAWCARGSAPASRP